MSEPTRFPLAWPAFRHRTRSRREGPFKNAGDPIRVGAALKRLTDELARLGATNALISSDIPIRLDGLPRANQPEPKDPGVCAYFMLAGKPYALACDTFSKVAQNLAGLAAHIEATRAITRHGVATSNETLQAFAALPPPGAPGQPAPPSTVAPERSWREVLRLQPNWPKSTGFTREVALNAIRGRYRDLAAQRHPDVPGGSESQMSELNWARDEALKEIG